MFGDKLKNAVHSVKGGEAAIVMDLTAFPVDSFEKGRRL